MRAERDPISLSFDVSAAVGSNEELTQRAWLFLPEHPADARAVLLCLAGGTYDKHYWHVEVEGHPAYSFGEHMAALGFVRDCRRSSRDPERAPTRSLRDRWD